MTFEIIFSLVIPLIGTILGSVCVFFFKKKMSIKMEKIFSGFAAGVMVAATIWSLIIPSFEASSSYGKLEFLPVVVGLWVGFAFLLVLDKIVPHLHINDSKPEGVKSNFKKSTMTALAVALHNLPEGMAVGVLIASASNESSNITMSMAIALAIGIAVQNFPEGAIISVPLHSNGMKKGKAFALGALSGLAEPLGALITILLATIAVPLLPYLLSFAAGAMLYVVVEELIPEMSKGEHSHSGILSFAIGFTLMMVLDHILG